MNRKVLLIAISGYVGGAFAQQTAWGQCGGSGWTGATTCISGYTCVYSNDWYSQCLPGTAATTTTVVTTTKKATTTTTPAGSSPTGWIVPGAVWLDTSGVKIDAHGGQVWKVSNTFYWLGASVGTSIQYPLSWAYRPKMFKGTSKYFIYGQVNRLVQPLSSSNIVGGYSLAGSAFSLPPYSLTYSDMGIFQDDDGKWYLATSADGNILQINVINGDGTLGTRLTKLGGELEAPGIFRAGTSAKTGYRANPNKVYWATSLSGPWTGPADIAPEDQNTYGSQNTHELVIKGSAATTYIYLGDAWDSSGTSASNYMWLPMAVSTSAHTVTLQYHAMWRVDVNSGVVSYPTNSKRYDAELAKLSGRAAITTCESCVSKRAVHQVDISSDVTFTGLIGQDKAQWVSIHYKVNDPQAGQAHVYINDEPTPRNISDFNSRAGYHGEIPIKIHLKAGAVNTLRIGSNGAPDFELHIDAVEVHED
ncbi:hypothetical protein TWF694_010012 [Orbilia ellipsospora]|uniref:CBM1 domain-containing protein n=1 Tax=Orbilia ellipsospora TaxID=2528407 RepID=A0AAV9X8P1_9PEZI